MPSFSRITECLTFFLFCTMTLSPTTTLAEESQAVATFAGGCFWCMESPFDELEGVTKTVVGYAGGKEKNPTYQDVASGATGHTEALQVFYDPSKLSYEKLLDVFWRQIDPTDAGGQFVDRGSQYRSEIFVHSDEQKKLAEASKQKLEASGIFKKPIVTPVTPFTTFFPAEDYHQDYYKTHSLKYKFYRYRSGRDQFLRSHWEEK